MNIPFLGKKERKPAILSKNLTFSYADKTVLQNLSLEIKSGSLTAIIGKSGSGKSTFLRLISGIIARKYTGKIRILGLFKQFSKNKLGFVPQEPSVIPDLSIEDNIKIIGLNFGITEEEAIKRATKLMEMLKLVENLKKKPTELSGGQRVRLNIILSILHNPEVVIMDEPFVGLDFENRRILWHFIEDLKKKGKSIIITSHLLSETQEHVDSLVILKDGKIFFHGKIDSLQNKLKMHFILEMKFSRISKEQKEKIAKYSAYRDIKILDTHLNYYMFAIESDHTRKILLNNISKINSDYEIISFREPNLDEIFLKA